jgi:hypothetical protein
MTYQCSGRVTGACGGGFAFKLPLPALKLDLGVENVLPGLDPPGAAALAAPDTERVGMQPEPLGDLVGGQVATPRPSHLMLRSLENQGFMG